MFCWWKSLKPPEIVALAKTPHIANPEMFIIQGHSDDKAHTEETLPLVPRKKTHWGIQTVWKIKVTGCPISMIAAFSEEPVSENLSPNTTSLVQDYGEEGPEAQEPLLLFLRVL